MAFIEGFPGQDTASHTLQRLGRLLVFAGLVTGVFLVSARDWRGELSVVVPTVTVVVLFMVGSSLKLTPMAWKRLFKKQEYVSLLDADRCIAQALSELDDTHFIFHDLRLEFFTCDHLVIGPGGIFAIRRAQVGQEACREGVSLTAVDGRLTAAARKLGQVCHFLALLTEKGFKIRCMPQPLFVCPQGAAGASGSVADVPLMSIEELSAYISSQKTDLSEDLPRRLAAFVHGRYASNSKN